MSFKSSYITPLRSRLLVRSLDKGLVTHKSAARLLIYPKDGFVFNRIKKSGNSSTLMFLAQYFLGFDSNNLTKSKAIEGVTSMDTLKFSDRKKLGEWDWMTVVRNPYTRVLSAYLDKSDAGQRGIKIYKDIPGFDRTDRHGFEQFINYIATSGLNDNGHWSLQSNQLYLAPEYYNYVIKLENFQSEFSGFLYDKGVITESEVFVRAHENDERTSDRIITGASSRLLDFYSPKIFELVRNVYNLDFNNFNYNANWEEYYEIQTK